MTGPTAAIVSFRLGGTDGVAIEAAKWQWALGQLGFEVVTVAGEGQVDHLLPGLAMGASEPPSEDEVERALAGADLVVVENLCSLPLNPRAAAPCSHGSFGRGVRSCTTTTCLGSERRRLRCLRLLTTRRGST